MRKTSLPAKSEQGTPPLWGSALALRRARYRLVLLALAAAVLVSTFVALIVGPMDLSVAQVGAAIVDSLARNREGIPSLEAEVVINMRLPRIVLALIVGAGLAGSGAALQSLFRNPLADPGLIGVSSGAAAGAAISVVLGTAALPSVAASVGRGALAFVGAILVTALVYVIGTVGGRTRIVVMLLAGIAVNALVAALTGTLVFLADDPELRSWTFWTLGGLSGATWTTTGVAAAAIVSGLAVLMRLRRALDVWLLGEHQLTALGYSHRRLRAGLVAATTLVVGASVAAAGLVAFVGLVVPHTVRLALGAEHRIVLPGSILGGALLLVLADTLCRTVVAPAEMPLSVVTSLVGAPFFIALVLRNRGSWL